MINNIYSFIIFVRVGVVAQVFNETHESFNLFYIINCLSLGKCSKGHVLIVKPSISI